MVRWQGELKSVSKEIAGSEVKDAAVESGEAVMSRAATLTLGVVGFLGSMIFWSQNVTGNAVLEFGKSSANWVGGILFVLAMIGFLVYVQKKKE